MCRNACRWMRTIEMSSMLTRLLYGKSASVIGWRLVCCLCLLLMSFPLHTANAATAPVAGTLLSVRAEASFLSPDGEGYESRYSEAVTVRVSAVEDASLDAPHTVSLRSRQWIRVPLMVRNTGNAETDISLDLRLNQAVLDLARAHVYRDVNGDNVSEAEDIADLSASGDASTLASKTFRLRPREGATLLIAALSVDEAELRAAVKPALTVAMRYGHGLTKTKTIALRQSVGASMEVSSKASTKRALAGDEITFTIDAYHSGDAQALPVRQIDGAPLLPGRAGEAAVLLRNPLPPGTRYVEGSLRITGPAAAHAIKLVRLNGDREWQYRQLASAGVVGVGGSAGAASRVVEVAVAFPEGLAQDTRQRMRYQVRLDDDYSRNHWDSELQSRADVYFAALAGQPASRASSNWTRIEVDSLESPDLIPALGHRGDFVSGHEVSLRAFVSNAGAAATVGDVDLSWRLPTFVLVKRISGAGWSCDGPTGPPSGVRDCHFKGPLLPSGRTPELEMTASLAPPMPGVSAVDVHITLAGGGEIETLRGNNHALVSVPVAAAAAISGHVWLDAAHRNRLDEKARGLKGYKAQLLHLDAGQGSRAAVVAEAVTDADGAYHIADVIPNRENYALRILSPDGRVLGVPQDGEQGVPTVMGSQRDYQYGLLRYPRLAPGKQYPGQGLAVQPTGIVYNALTRRPVAGAIVTLTSDRPEFRATEHLLTHSTQSRSDENGYYYFALTPDAPVGMYTLRADAAHYQAGWSRLLPPQRSAAHPHEGVGEADPVVESLAIPPVSERAIYHPRFLGGGRAARIVNNHLALDDGAAIDETLSLNKEASQPRVELIDFLGYKLVLQHKLDGTLPGFHIDDDLPPGFSYVQGSSRLGIGAEAPRRIADPTVSGRHLHYNLLDSLRWNLPPNTPATLTYRVRVGATAQAGKAVNRALAVSGAMRSNLAKAEVEVDGGVFSDDAFVAGKVFLDCDGDGSQGEKEPGVPGVRIYMEDGTYAETDIYGKYSLYGLKPLTHVLKLDSLTLPAGTEPLRLDNRNADGHGRFLDLRNGELGRGDFALSCPPGVREQIAERQSRLSDSTEVTAAVKRDLENQFDLGKPALANKHQAASGLVNDYRRQAAQQLAEQAADEASQQDGAGRAQRALGVSTKRPETSGQAIGAPQSVAMNDAHARARRVDLEQLIAAQTAQPGFLGLVSGQVLDSSQIRVRVKGHLGAQLLLSVNGEAIPVKRVGKRVEQAERGLLAWEYIGIDLKPGKNILTLRETFAQAVPAHEVSVEVTAPGALAKLRVHLPEHPVADDKTPLRIEVETLDEHDLPVRTYLPLTLQSSAGAWQAHDQDPDEDGTQVFIEGGRGSYSLLPPADAGEIVLQVRSGVIESRRVLKLLPKLRPMIAVGVLEGVISLRNRSIEGLRDNNGFERELKSLSRHWSGDQNSFGSRAAFFLKGQVKGKYLLTAAFDSDKQARERLFRDIEPDRYYPVYGDSSTRGFDAQSTSRLYLRIDREHTYLLLGDFSTGSHPDLRQLTQYDRGVTGLKHHYENSRLELNTFASRDSVSQRVNELAATGGFFYPDVFGADYVVNSERVEVVTRSRNQHGRLVGLPRTLSRFADYIVDEFGNLSLKGDPVHQYDEAGNPNFIRITYESDGDGPKFWLYGADAQFRLLDGLTLGGVMVDDKDPANPRRLRGLTVQAQLGSATDVAAEYARTHSLENGDGNGTRMEIKHKSGRLRAEAFAVSTDAGFDNISSTTYAGHREIRGKLDYAINAESTLKIEAIHNRDRPRNGDSSSIDGAQLALERKLSSRITVEGGTRLARGRIKDTGGDIGERDVDALTLRGKLTSVVPALPKARVFGEYEQDVRDAAKRAFALGGDYQLGKRGRLYARHELVSSLGSMYEFERNQRTSRTLFGVEQGFSKEGRLFSEYRQGGAIGGREAQAAYGLRDGWQLRPGLRLSAAFERTSGRQGSESTALTSGLEYLAHQRWKGSTSLQLRRGSGERSALFNAALAYKLNEDWALLGKTAWYRVFGRGGQGGGSLHSRHRIGAAYRPAQRNDLNALMFYEHRESWGDRLFDDDGSSRTVHMASLHVNWQPVRRTTVSARYAAKLVRQAGLGTDTTLHGHLLAGRLTRDLSERWDIGVSGAVLIDSWRQRKNVFGVEAGYLVKPKAWISVGYNLLGFRDREFSSLTETVGGFYLRLRYRFDELGF